MNFNDRALCAQNIFKHTNVGLAIQAIPDQAPPFLLSSISSLSSQFPPSEVPIAYLFRHFVQDAYLYGESQIAWSENGIKPWMINHDDPRAHGDTYTRWEKDPEHKGKGKFKKYVGANRDDQQRGIGLIVMIFPHYLAMNSALKVDIKELNLLAKGFMGMPQLNFPNAQDSLEKAAGLLPNGHFSQQTISALTVLAETPYREFIRDCEKIAKGAHFSSL